VDIIAKPKVATKRDMLELEMRIHDTIQSAAIARFRSRSGIGFAPVEERATSAPVEVREKLSADEVLPPPSAISIGNIPTTEKIISLVAVHAEEGPCRIGKWVRLKVLPGRAASPACY
tara:strand:- start:622 stop:975 length:354 start_codon:yes stop_codon:yes gene_type:complete